MNDSDFAAAFRDASLPTTAFHHRDHVRLAWIYLRELGPDAALPRFAVDLQSYARAHGVSGLYHATITGAYLELIAARLAALPQASWEEFAVAYPELLQWKPGLLERHYSEDLLASPLARERFLAPDRAPFESRTAKTGEQVHEK
ncbi:MAG: hypothetical protein JNM84_11175 [Planctomycetes bacterium]|nr:hypothetical protein [Planctomycetota bacterium]